MNSAKEIVYEFNMERTKAFKAQDSETGDFDVVFDIAGNKLYAHRCMLSLISPTFKSMLSDRWTTPGKPVKIEGYFYDDFTEFITFIYSGACQLTDANIFAMVDMAEFFGIRALKKECQTFLSGMLNLENVYQMIELVNKYSLDEFKKSLIAFISSNLAIFCKSPQFQYLQKSVVHDFVEANQETPNREELFEAVYKWAENQATEKQTLDQSLNYNEAIKNELSEFLPFIKFKKMEHSFLIKFVVRKSFLFSDDELDEILFSSGKLFVKVIDKNGKLMKGEVRSDDVESVANVIESIKNQSCENFDFDYCYWNTKQPKPTTPSKLIENDNIEWYLVYDDYGNVSIVKRNELKENDYLLAEMSAEEGFEFSYDCKIEICLCSCF